MESSTPFNTAGTTSTFNTVGTTSYTTSTPTVVNYVEAAPSAYAEKAKSRENKFLSGEISKESKVYTHAQTYTHTHAQTYTSFLNSYHIFISQYHETHTYIHLLTLLSAIST
jgi:hypothetical protein